MIKIEVRIRQTIGELTVEHEYRADLPDGATADQIKAVGAEAQAAIPAPEVPEQQGSIHIGKGAV